MRSDLKVIRAVLATAATEPELAEDIEWLGDTMRRVQLRYGRALAILAELPAVIEQVDQIAAVDYVAEPAETLHSVVRRAIEELELIDEYAEAIVRPHGRTERLDWDERESAAGVESAMWWPLDLAMPISSARTGSGKTTAQMADRPVLLQAFWSKLFQAFAGFTVTTAPAEDGEGPYVRLRLGGADQAQVNRFLEFWNDTDAGMRIVADIPDFADGDATESGLPDDRGRADDGR